MMDPHLFARVVLAILIGITILSAVMASAQTSGCMPTNCPPPKCDGITQCR